MAEVLTLTVPPVPAVREDYRVGRLELDWDLPRVAVTLFGPDGKRIGHHYGGEQARALLRDLNTANLSALSLQRRLMQRLVLDVVVNGTITGVPE